MKKVILLWAIYCLAASLWVQRGSAQAFVEQVGQLTDPQLQARTDIDFKVVQEGGLQVFVSNEGLQYQWIVQASNSDSMPMYSAYRMDMQLIGANPKASIVKGPQLAAYERYYLSWVNVANQDEGVIAHRYQSILYKDVYPHIDWRLYFTEEGALEYDFLIHPGGDIQQIQWQYSGHDSITKTADGSLEIRTPKGGIVQQAPISFEQASRLFVPSNYIVQGNTVRFQTGAYSGVLVIDPVIKWGTYFGDLADDYCHDIAVDSIGNIYMVGTTNSVSNIATQGAHQQTFGGGSYYLGADAFINKLDTAGQLLWATYYGGSNIDMMQNIAIDSAGAVYIAGYTNSTDGIASANAYQATKKGTANRYDVVLVKLDADGVRQWGTYFGGTLQDGDKGVALTIDAANNIWIGSNTSSDDILITNDAYRKNRQFSDGFITKFSNNGNAIFSSYVGGNGDEFIKGIAVDSMQNIYVLGESVGSTDMATINAHQSAFGGGTDAFVAKLDSVATPLWATYIGGSGNEVANSIVLVNSYVLAGITTTSANLSYGNAIKNNVQGSDGLLMQINQNGQMEMISYLGGELSDVIADIAFNKGQINILLRSLSTTGVVDSNALFNTINGEFDFIWLQYDVNWQKLYSTYIGGNKHENQGCIALSQQHVYIAGSTLSNNNIATTGSYQTLNAGSNDAFVIKIADCNPILWSNNSIQGSDSICAHQQYTFSVAPHDSVAYHWMLPNSWQGGSDSHSIAVTPDVQSGTIAVWLSNSCDLQSDTLFKTIGIFNTLQPIIQKQGNVLVCPQAYAAYQWYYEGNSIPGAQQANYIPTQNGRYQLLATDINGCAALSDSIHITHLGIPDIVSSWVQVYPNPVQSVLQVEVAAAAVVRIYNALGQAVGTYNVTKGAHSLSMEPYAAGVYVLLVDFGEQQFRKVLVRE